MRVPTESYEKIYQDYSKALEWLENIGVQIGSGRTNHYRKIIGYWKDAYKIASEEEGDIAFPDFVSSMFEIHSFISVYNAFRDVSETDLSEIAAKLQKGVNGPINAVDESPKSTTARNFIFEAVVAARAHRPRAGVQAILKAKSDTGIKIDNAKLWIECKRVTTTGKIAANVRKASSQLEVVIKKQHGSGHRGIVALDVTKILNVGDRIYVSKDDSQLMASTDRLMDRFIIEYSHIWQELYKRRDRKVIGTLINFSFMATSESRNLLVHTSQWGLNPRNGISGRDQEILKTLAATLKRTA
ncbi:hypothetical protein [Kineobactrum salinum]|uniref:Uncharacterized protein n=1 Tax=Kineobactrum salinum TaxID=2708301 RepID=A0A6C0U4M4_9GAMM|nr:hypothetical protein [Kineobactrum salinum]QIB66956.1 hypothetical protein G3T16_17735 [Kineobactrum salinum]